MVERVVGFEGLAVKVEGTFVRIQKSRDPCERRFFLPSCVVPETCKIHVKS
jgi:hypothetical protein